MSLRSICTALALLLLLAAAGCRPDAGTPPLQGASSEPATAVRQLAERLHANDLVGYARAAVPPEDYDRFEAAWRDGHSRWPLSAMPLGERVPSLLQALSAPDAKTRLRRSFDRQLANQNSDLKEAARSLGLFGQQFLQHEADYPEDARQHYLQMVAALSAWGQRAPLGDPALGRAAVDRLVAAAQATGLDGDAALQAAGMQASLQALGPFLAESKAVLAGYGLDLDHSLAELQTGLVEQDGDRASVRIHYPLAGQEIDAVVRLRRHDGHWYLDSYLQAAQALPAPPETEMPEAPPIDPDTLPPDAETAADARAS
ncbi:hypothetical protein CSC70_02580 [Pseudoxanthomonas kalamensis DSM 18571]|uniref:hypothetical protein n=1 Tax=Pseudoxanthomonas kalamensis TaxID=289483 RepID=UPI001390E32A|nr:hypothetical protein [Pseudoxanthomonas kalamensis]KAF1712425.1 hypothetical protein CSC70_02580 [Pseudoxanthomonas kalamensis DSM 18571]